MAKKINRPHLIYFVQAHGGRVDQLVKLGCSSDVPLRLKALRTVYQTSLVLLATAMPKEIDGFSLEHYAHRMLAKYLAYQQEWFFPTTEVLRMATQCAIDNEWLADLYPAPLMTYPALLARESVASWRDHEALAFEHYKHRTYAVPSVHRPIRSASLKLAHDITCAIVAPSKLYTPSFAPNIEKAA